MAAGVVEDAKVSAAWDEYLEQCRGAEYPWRYEEVEEWAWAVLQRTLRALDPAR